MGAPPHDKAKGGRVNPAGISILYLSDEAETTLYEIRAGVYDYVTVGCFKLLKDIEVINLANIDRISPFIGIDYGFDLTQYAMNIEHLKMIAQEIAKPLRNDNTLDYLPPQYISDYIRSKGYNGIEYGSTMRKQGFNLAVFDPMLLRCQRKIREVYFELKLQRSCKEQTLAKSSRTISRKQNSSLRQAAFIHSHDERKRTPLFSCSLLRSRCRKSLATDGFAGAFSAR